MKASGVDLRKVLDESLKELEPVLMEFPWHDPVVYAHWVAQTFYYCRHTTRLLALAGSRIDLSRMQLHFRFMEHVREEKGHEYLAQNDLKKLGFSMEQIGEYPETSAFYLSQYAWIEHVHPTSFFGFILALEEIGKRYCPTFFQKASKAHGKEAVSFIRVHAEEDVDHMEKAFKFVDELPADWHASIAQNLKQTTALYASILNRATSESQRGRFTSAA